MYNTTKEPYAFGKQYIRIGFIGRCVATIGSEVKGFWVSVVPKKNKQKTGLEDSQKDHREQQQIQIQETEQKDTYPTDKLCIYWLLAPTTVFHSLISNEVI